MTKKVLITMPEEMKKEVKRLSKEWNMDLFGKDKQNISGFIAYLIHKASKESQTVKL